MFKLFDTVNDVKMQIQKKRRKDISNGMWGSQTDFWNGGNQGGGGEGNNGWGNQGGNNNGWGNQGGFGGNNNNGWGNNQSGWQNQNQNIGNVGLQMALFGNQNLWGNNVSGPGWVEEQLKRTAYRICSPGEQNNFNLNDIQSILEKQIIFLEPSPAQKKIEELKRQGKTFEDERFPPNLSSLTGEWGNVHQWAKIQWKKATEQMPKAQMFKGKIEPNDIKQGYLGDCYFLAGLAALAERPDRIFSLFLVQEVNQVKYYSVKMIYKGKWMTIDMDDYVPFLYGKPAFTKANDNQLWVVMLQKAWAKLYTSYKRIEAGYPEEALHDLTGAPIKNIYMKQASFNAEREWKYLEMASHKQYSMVASSRPGSDTTKSQSGIVQGHAYTFLNATVLHYNGGSERVVQLRNPWGKGESKGRWSDHDHNWNKVSQQQKQRVGYKNNQDDGIFFMTYNDFVQEFRALTVAEINDNASYIYKSMKDKEGKGVYFRLEIVQQGYYSLQIDKTPERSYNDKKQSQYHYPQARIDIGKINGNNCTKLESAASTRRTLFKGYNLDPGVYIVFAKILYNASWERQFDVNLAVYAEYACDIEIASRNDAIAFTGNQSVQWNPPQPEKNPQSWNNMGNREFQGNSGWNQGGGGGNNGWGNQGGGNNNNNNGWGNQGGGNNNNNNGWGNQGGGNNNNNNGWGNQGGNGGNGGNNGWGNMGGGGQPKKDDGWGNQGGNGGNNGWGNMGGGGQPKKDDGWGNQGENGGNNGWGNMGGGGQPKKDDGWGNQGGNNGWGPSNNNNGW